ncbi:O-antigen ligase family protein [Nodosilinea sp. PGN35]|uniref:O-antigen ligase family protein n=1 Tax=Nodosilinea sp. PGN35 TaxID=3020489 RepID=UPI0023B240E5|nr:O-antigen ligase family protein [Nodosilinea sp. TSF1-S3]MDF0367033.1 O-antigen ligase family protein [Nodosilinea sp. TSF1-S3]
MAVSPTNTTPDWRRSLLAAVLAAIAGLAIGGAAGASPLLIAVGLVALGLGLSLVIRLEYTVLALFIVRSGLDLFSNYQLPVAFALGIDALAIGFVALLLMGRRRVHLDGFWVFFALWVALQGLWVVLMGLGTPGMERALLPSAVREWVRLFSWLLGYLLILQFKDRLPPQRVLGLLFLALVIPLLTATMQMVVPPHLLPGVLVFDGDGAFEANSRISGSLGHSNTFGTYVLFFLGLTYWKMLHSQRRLGWLALMGVLAFFLVSTKALGALAMFGTFILLVTIPKLSLGRLLGSGVLAGAIAVLFTSTEFGRDRLASLYDTPLLNPEINWSRSILLSWFDGNSFNWRIAQWTFLTDAWREAPLLGRGLNSSSYLSVFQNYAHNDYVRALAEGGIVGLGLFLLFLGAQAFWLARIICRHPPNHPRRNLALILLAFLGASLVGMSTENIWSHTTLYYYWWLIFAVLSWEWSSA